MFLDFNYSYQQVSVGQRAEIAITHVLNIPERLLNIIVQLAKLFFFGLLSALSFGHTKLFNAEVRFAFKRLLGNTAGVGNALVGIFAPLNALKWQEWIFDNLISYDLSNPYKQPSRNNWAAAILSI